MVVTTSDDLTNRTGPDAPSKRERNKAEKHRRIVDAARRLFRERGFEDATTADISAAAGIGTGTLYLYVDSKEDLLVEVFLGDAERAWSEAIARIDPAAPLVDQLVDVFCDVTDFHLQEPMLSRASFRELPFTTGDVRSRCREFQHRVDNQLADVLRQAQADGRLIDGIDCLVLATNLFAAWHVQMQRSLGRGPEQGDLRPVLQRSVHTALIGLNGPSGPPGRN